jgi:hypothetical protein
VGRWPQSSKCTRASAPFYSGAAALLTILGSTIKCIQHCGTFYIRAPPWLSLERSAITWLKLVSCRAFYNRVVFFANQHNENTSNPPPLTRHIISGNQGQHERRAVIQGPFRSTLDFGGYYPDQRSSFDDNAV